MTRLPRLRGYLEDGLFHRRQALATPSVSLRRQSNIISPNWDRRHISLARHGPLSREYLQRNLPFPICLKGKPRFLVLYLRPNCLRQRNGRSTLHSYLEVIMDPLPQSEGRTGLLPWSQPQLAVRHRTSLRGPQAPSRLLHDGRLALPSFIARHRTTIALKIQEPEVHPEAVPIKRGANHCCQALLNNDEVLDIPSSLLWRFRAMMLRVAYEEGNRFRRLYLSTQLRVSRLCRGLRDPRGLGRNRMALRVPAEHPE